MAYRWANISYPYTPSKVDYTASSVGSIQGHSGDISQWHIGNDPLYFTYPSQQSMSLSYEVTSRLKINMTMTPSGTRNWRVYSIVIDNTEVWNSGNQATATGWMTDVGFVVNDANHRAFPMVIDRQGGSGTTTYNIRNLGFSETSYSWMQTFYNEIIVAEGLIAPDWHAVNSVSGELGTFEFSKIAQEHINNGNSVTTSDPTYIERFMSSTEILQMIRNFAPSDSKNVIYSGSHAPYTPGNYLTLTGLGSGYTRLSFKNEGTEFFSFNLYPVTGHKYYLSFLIDRNNLKGLLSIIDVSENPLTITYNNVTMSISQMQSMYRWLLDSDDSVTPTVNKDEPGKGADPWGTPDDIDPLTAPTISAIDTGFTSMFQVTKTELQSLSDFLWSAAFVDNVKKFFNDPREIIVGIAIMPVAPEVGGDMTIQAGGISTGITGKPLTSQYKLLEDIGTVYIKAENGNFLDYPPYTKITVHLPFCGEHSLDVNDVMGKTLKLSYLFDFLSGSVVAAIKVDGSTNYFFGGSCGMQVPSSSEDFGRMYSSILSAGATLGSALATVATGGLTAPLAIGAGAAMAGNGMNMTPEVQHTSGSGSINGMLGNQSAYITVEKPNAKLAEDQKDFVGNMALITEYIGNVKGFIKCYKYHLDGVTATLDERKEIESYLSNGFRRETGSTLPSVTPVTTGNSTILFMKCTSENDVMGKTWNNTTLKLEGKIIYNQSVLSPEFIIEGDVTGYNYAYIDLFKRYYYITNITVNEKNMMTVSFKVDVLQSFKSQIDDCRVIMERATDLSASMMNDPQYWTLQNKDVYPYYFKQSNGSNVVFSRSNNVFILTIAGSNARTP